MEGLSIAEQKRMLIEYDRALVLLAQYKKREDDFSPPNSKGMPLGLTEGSYYYELYTGTRSHVNVMNSRANYYHNCLDKG